MFTEVIYFMTNLQFNNNYDVFHSFLVEKADYDGYFEFPKIRTSNQLPDKVITFSKNDIP